MKIANTICHFMNFMEKFDEACIVIKQKASCHDGQLGSNISVGCPLKMCCTLTADVFGKS